jgi:hypothetical protein
MHAREQRGCGLSGRIRPIDQRCASKHGSVGLQAGANRHDLSWRYVRAEHIFLTMRITSFSLRNCLLATRSKRSPPGHSSKIMYLPHRR